MTAEFKTKRRLSGRLLSSYGFCGFAVSPPPNQKVLPPKRQQHPIASKPVAATLLTNKLKSFKKEFSDNFCGLKARLKLSEKVKKYSPPNSYLAPVLLLRSKDSGLYRIHPSEVGFSREAARPSPFSFYIFAFTY
jgi:hypothetical protein